MLSLENIHILSNTPTIHLRQQYIILPSYTKSNEFEVIMSSSREVIGTLEWRTTNIVKEHFKAHLVLMSNINVEIGKP